MASEDIDCPFCGYTIPKKSTVCGHCGAKSHKTRLEGGIKNRVTRTVVCAAIGSVLLLIGFGFIGGITLLLSPLLFFRLEQDETWILDQEEKRAR